MHARALALLRARYPQYIAMALDDRERNPVVRIEAARVTLWRGGRLTPRKSTPTALCGARTSRCAAASDAPLQDRRPQVVEFCLHADGISGATTRRGTNRG
jgi:hypothetical protein